MSNNTKSLKWNTIANFVGLGYTSIIGIVILPLYLQYLGPEAFGLVGFFTLLQSWMQLFDMGMSPMLSRQTAQARGQNIDFLALKKLLRSLELIFLLITIMVILGISISSSWIVDSWLNISTLSSSDVSICIVLMGVIIGLRFFTSLYRSGIQGIESQVWLNITNMVLVTFKFIGSLLLLRFITQDFIYFFIYQLAIAIIELIIMAVYFYSLIPTPRKVGFKLFWNTLKPSLPFAGGIAYTSGLWILLTQLDKLILSNILPLAEYGYFALVAVVSLGVSQISGTISQAILPRMTYFLSQGKSREMMLLYRQSTQIMSIIIMPITGMVALFSTELLFAWTGDIVAAKWASPILFWFALGSGILSISAFQYYLQFAHGMLKMHVIYNSISASIQIPIIIYVAFEYGAEGVAVSWFTLRLISFIIWTPIVHNKFAPGIHWPWLIKDILPVFLSTLVLILLFNSASIGFDEMNRLGVFATLLSLGLVSLIVNIFVSKVGRDLVYTALKKSV